MTSSHPRKPGPELLAPAGHIESFFAAIENGADAIYVGLRELSARATATNFTLPELARLLPYAHARHVSIYVALNSLVAATQFSAVLDLLQALNDLGADAVIIQDAGLFPIVRRHFPKLKIHASTLTAIHNHLGVETLARQGAHRVVLARELSFQEIRQIAKKTTCELEIFVHGALCFSYSGLCLASSFRGGHSGLQGRCVQPCRLRFRQGRKQGYFLSCSDFSALDWIPQLLKLRLAAFKIEGRMKGADYIGNLVKAYRHVMDAPQAYQHEAVREAQQWVTQAPARRLSAGFLGPNPDQEVLAPHRSGSSGLWIATVQAQHHGGVLVRLRHQLRLGDRLRIESKDGKEKSAFTVTRMCMPDGSELREASHELTVMLRNTPPLNPGERLFKIDSKTRNPTECWQTVRREIPRRNPFRSRFRDPEIVLAEWSEGAINWQRTRETLILKIAHHQDLAAALQSPAQRVILTANRSNLEKLSRTRWHPAQKKRFAWALPPIIAEKDISYYEGAVGWYLKRGFLTWEINNWAHVALFPAEGRHRLQAGYRFNLRNIAALNSTANIGCRWAVLSLEITVQELRLLAQAPLITIPIISIYSWPPLFVSRLKPRLQTDKPFVTARNDRYFYLREGGCSLIHADRPVNWMGHLATFRSLGYRHFMIDLSEGPRNQGSEIPRLLSGFKRCRADQPSDLFNLERQPFAEMKKGQRG